MKAPRTAAPPHGSIGGVAVPPTDPPTDEEGEARLLTALVEEACRRSGVIWLQVEGGDRAHAAWHTWHDGAVHVVTGGAEQPLPDLAAAAHVRVTVPSKDTRARLVTWVAKATTLAPETEEWATAAAALHATRLNAPDGEDQPARWARESTILRLEPTTEVLEHPGAAPTDSHAAPPAPSPATTRGKLPFVLGRRARSTKRQRR
jgi:hypothetical protein